MVRSHASGEIESSGVCGVHLGKVILANAASWFGGQCPRPSIGHKNDVYFCSMLRTAIGVLSESNALAPSFDPEQTPQSSPAGYLERSETPPPAFPTTTMTGFERWTT
jgi:hypothetical protein